MVDHRCARIIYPYVFLLYPFVCVYMWEEWKINTCAKSYLLCMDDVRMFQIGPLYNVVIHEWLRGRQTAVRQSADLFCTPLFERHGNNHQRAMLLYLHLYTYAWHLRMTLPFDDTNIGKHKNSWFEATIQEHSWWKLALRSSVQWLLYFFTLDFIHNTCTRWNYMNDGNTSRENS